MSLFVNTSSLHNHFLDCSALDVSETIERDCLSVLHKLHDQVNGLQLVQVVVQPLARLFNPASLAALISNTSTNTTPVASLSNNNNQLTNTATGTQQNANTPTIQNPHGCNLPSHDLDELSIATGTSVTTIGSSSHNVHSRSQGLASAHNTGASNSNSAGNNSGNSSNLLMSSTSTYMMSPDTAQALIARLDTDRDVNWLMEIIGYGLSMPFSLSGEQDSVKDCCTIYCEWLVSALLPYDESNKDSKYQQLSKLVPVPIRNEPNRYARKMLSHLYNVFLPRQTLNPPNSNLSQKEQIDTTLTAVSRQAVLCHRVLRTIEGIAQNQSNLMDNETWDHLLALLLTVNDKLLSSPTEPDDIGTQLHDRILGVLFELILLASAKSIPTPNLWKTFHEMSLNWRHRPALVDHWRRITLLLTRRILILSSLATRHGDRPDGEANISELERSNILNPSAIEAAIASMSYENISQTWYRFLNLIGNPVELSDPNIISRTDEFYHAACASDNVLDPRQHPCLNVLPQIFMNSMAGLRDFIETFLGTYHTSTEERQNVELSTPDRPPPYSQSSRGSIVSLNSKNSSVFTPVLQNVGIHQTHHSSNQHAQPQAVTPTQNRKTGIKSIGIKGGKAIPFTSAPSSNLGGSLSTVHGDSNQSQEQQQKSVSSSLGHRPAQLNHPRPSLTNLPIKTSQTINPYSQFKLNPERPKCNSILHVFGDWLFSAALIGSDLNQEIVEASDEGSSTSIGSSSTTTETGGQYSFSPSLSRRRPSIPKSVNSNSRQSGQYSRRQGSLTGGLSSAMLDPPLTADSFELGQAEAMAILCKIFSSKTSTEDISPVYLSRFYLCLQHCLTYGTGQDQRSNQSASFQIKRQLLSSVLVNSTNLLQKDLDGINLLIPSFIKAIEFVFECNEKEAPVQAPPRQHNRSSSIRNEGSNPFVNVTNYELKRACISTLSNLLAYPNHFRDLVIRNCLNESSPTTTFGSLRPRLLKLLFVALQTETDPINMQILFGSLSLTIHDLASDSGKSKNQDDSFTRSLRRTDSTSGSGNSGSYSTGNSLDANTGGKYDESTGAGSFVFNSKTGLLVKCLHVTCHLLINIWKHDTQVSLAALELLTTIARISTSIYMLENTAKQRADIQNNNNRVEMRNEYKQTTKWICDYICNQCSRPPPAHSRDMHSTIVAAYQCLSVWFYHHPYLLNDDSCVVTLMEVIELGVSGQKSKTLSLNPVTGLSVQSKVSKGEKVMKPSSMRVREAAESLLNICMVRTSNPNEPLHKIMSTYDTVLDEYNLAEIFGGAQYKTDMRHVLDNDIRRIEAYKLFKFFSDDDCVIFGLMEGVNHDPALKDSVICLLRTPFGKHCWKMKFNYYTEKFRDKIIANKTQGLIKRPFQQSSTPTTEIRMFPFSGPQLASSHNDNSVRFFASSIDDLPYNHLDHLVTSLDNYPSIPEIGDHLKNSLDKITKLYAHQVLAEQQVMSECSIRIKRADCEEPQPLNELETARLIVAHLGLKTSLSPMSTQDKISPSFIQDMKSLDQQSMRTCDCVNIFYVRKNRTSPHEILESVRERNNVSLSFFEWILELGQPLVVKHHSRWTGKTSNSWNNRRTFSGQENDNMEQKSSPTRNQLLLSNHGGAIFDGERMTLYWSDMCQELAFLIPHKMEKLTSISDQTKAQFQNDQSPVSNQHNSPTLSVVSDQSSDKNIRGKGKNVDQSCAQMMDLTNSDGQSLNSLASDASGQSARVCSQQGSPKDPISTSGKDQRDNVSLSRQSITANKRKSVYTSSTVGCDTNIIICWLECKDDMQEVPCEALLSIAESGYLLDELIQEQQPVVSMMNTNYDGARPRILNRLRSRDYVKYFISPMKNGLFRVNLVTSFGRHWLALPLVDGMTVSKTILSGLIRESVLNLCRRRRLDADSYQPPHVRRRIKIQDICNTYKISSRHSGSMFWTHSDES